MSHPLNHLTLFNQLIRLSRTLEAKLMTELVQQGFKGLTMSFADPMMIITLGPVRMNELADELGMSKQLCNQSLKPLEQLDIIQRQVDPNDGRAKLVSLTPRGKALASQAQNIILQLQTQMAKIIGENSLAKLHQGLFELSQGAQLRAGELVPTTGLMSLLSRHTERQLMQLTMQQGFDFLQLSYSQVLNYLAPHDSKNISLSQLAKINHISLQAISRISRELEQHHIISKQYSDNDKRVKVIKLTKTGEQLFNKSIESAEQLHQTFSQWVNPDQLNNCSQYLTTLNQASESLLSLDIQYGAKKPAHTESTPSQDNQQLVDTAKQSLQSYSPGKLSNLSSTQLEQLIQLLD